MSKILLTIPNLKNCIFGAVSIVKYIDKRMWMYSCYGITFDRAGLWKLDYNFARNIVNLVLMIGHHLILIIPIIFSALDEGPTPTRKMLNFQIRIVSEVYLIDLVLLSLEKYLMIFQSIIILFINLKY